MRLSNCSTRILSTTLAYALCVTSLTPQPAQAGVLAGLATEWTQIANNVQLISSYIRQGEELRQKILTRHSRNQRSPGMMREWALNY